MSKNSGTRKALSRGRSRAAKIGEDAEAAAGPAAPGRPKLIVRGVHAVDYDVSPKWQKRLKELDDYQRSAPFVLSRFTLD